MKNYVGNKNVPGVIEFLVNRIPKSERYFSLFMGGAGLENSVYTGDITFYCSEKDTSLWDNRGENLVLFENYQELIEHFNFTADDFIFADPPYMFSTRRSRNKYYKHEFYDQDHIEFLNYMRSIKAKVLITHPKNELYTENLTGFSIEEFTYMTRSGMFNDAIYYNYDYSSIELINYNGLGANFTERQAIKRQRINIVNKFKNLSLHKRMALIEDLKKENLL